MKQILIAIDQLANAVIDAIFFWDRQGPKRHCQLSYESELLRTQLPHSYRGVL